MPAEVKRYHFGVDDLLERIDWHYFHWAWGVTKAGDEEQGRLRRDANQLLAQWRHRQPVKALLMTIPANSDGDDLILGDRLDMRMPMLRQQNMKASDGHSLCVADFVRPVSHGVRDTIGMFCTTVDDCLTTGYDNDPYLRMMAQTLADRLAEAAAERVNDDMPGIRPAVGYPMMPDMSLNFIIDSILDMRSVGITLTETGMMMPHASVSGIIIQHPAAHYFNIGSVGNDQLEDYARRRGMTVAEMRRFIKS